MAPINRNSISLYEDAKATFVSLLQQTAQVGAGLIVMLLLTGGNPPGFIMGLSFCLGVGFVAWSENNRLEKLTTSVKKPKQKIEQLITSSTEFNLDEFVPKNINFNKYVILRAKINLISYPTTHLELEKLIQKILSIETNDFFELAQILDLDIKKDFARSNLKGAYLVGADLGRANLRGAILEGANLEDAILESAILEGADLVDANLVDANLGRAYLVGADLGRANLRGADLRGADLWDANLRDANLWGTDLWGTDLKDANLVGAIVENARFGYNKGLSDEMIKELKNRGAIFIDLQGDPRTVEIKR